MIYVDINNSYSATSGNGGELTPYNVVQFTDYVTSALATNDIFGVRGYYSNLGAGTIALNFCSNSAVNISIQSWDNQTYGYWKMEGDTISFDLGEPGNPGTIPKIIYFKDFIVSDFTLNRNHNTSALPVYFMNGIFRSISDFEANNSNNSRDYFKGCTFAGAVVLNDDYYNGNDQGEYQFDDCVFYDAPLSDDVTKTVVFNYCTFSGTSAYNTSSLTTSAITINNCTFSWVPLATLPTIDQITSANKGNLSFESFGLDYTFATRRNVNWEYFDESNRIEILTEGAYGSHRRGPGSFNFTNNIFYVDLSAITTSGTGTILKPLEGSLVSASTSFYNDDEVRMRGSLVLSGNNTVINFCGTSGIFIDAWDVSAYGPWKIVQRGNHAAYAEHGFKYANNLYLKNGILYVKDYKSNENPTFSVPVILLENMFIKLDTDGDDRGPTFYVRGGLDGVTLTNKRLTMKGCTFIMDGPSLMDLARTPSDNISLVARDCVFDIANFAGPVALSTSAYLDNCVFVAADKATLADNIFSAADNITDTECQYGWVASEWPDITGNINPTEMSFHNLTLDTHEITISGSGQW